MNLGRQSQAHLDLARKFLSRAKEASKRTRTGCDHALPHLVKAVENLSAAWEHIDSISDAPPPRGRDPKKGMRAIEQRLRQTRAKEELGDEYVEIRRVVARDLEIYLRRCTRRRA